MSAEGDAARRWFVPVDADGTTTLPGSLRQALGCDRPGMLLEFAEHTPGVFMVRSRGVPHGQAWFWIAEWQAGEAEADADLAAGRHVDYESVDEFLADVDG